jgi:hypothetical protein
LAVRNLAGSKWRLWALGRGVTLALAVAAHAFGCRHRLVADRWTSALVRFRNVGRFRNAIRSRNADRFRNRFRNHFRNASCFIWRCGFDREPGLPHSAQIRRLALRQRPHPAVYSLTRRPQHRFGCPKNYTSARRFAAQRNFNTADRSTASVVQNSIRVVQKLDSNHVEGLCVFPEETISQGE